MSQKLPRLLPGTIWSPLASPCRRRGDPVGEARGDGLLAVYQVSATMTARQSAAVPPAFAAYVAARSC
jgi:hypothetical protein